jgi:hypothetical protein
MRGTRSEPHRRVCSGVGEESLVRGRMLWGSSGGGFYRGRCGGEWPGEAEKQPAMGQLQWPSNSGSSLRVKA